MKKVVTFFIFLLPYVLSAQIQTASSGGITPELLWQLGRVSGMGLSPDKKHVVYSVSTPEWQTNKSTRKFYMIPVAGGAAIEISKPDSVLRNKNLSPDGKYQLTHKEVKVNKVFGKDHYPELEKSNVQVYDQLNYRHWDSWEDGKFSHVFLSPVHQPDSAIDLMPDEPFDTPQKPFGGDEDYIWSPDGKRVIYVSKKKYGTAYAVSTNTDLYEYNIETGKTRNVTEGRMGYDIAPLFSSTGTLAWLSMKREGYESDKEDIVAMTPTGTVVNLTGHRDEIHVAGFRWAEDGRNIFFWAPVNGTLQLFQVAYTTDNKSKPEIRQITRGDFDINGIIGQNGNLLIVSRTDMNTAAELYTVDVRNGNMKILTSVNDAIYSQVAKSRTERRFVTTTDGKQMLVWVIYPPNFEPSKKYPTLLYAQGGPQSPLTQSYSFRWNFHLMASQGYIVVAPARRGMPGFGTQWNEEISGAHGGQVMKDYLSAINAISREPFVDTSRLGAVGASYGGYSVFLLAGIHNNLFKSFISHNGIFDTRSMYGTTEEMFFVNWDYGGPFWDKDNAVTQKAYNEYNPINYVDKWNTPIMIIQGGKDYRVPIGQGLQAFTAAQLRGVKSKLLYLPEENHWVLSPQNALVWQREFFKWLQETMPAKSF